MSAAPLLRHIETSGRFSSNCNLTCHTLFTRQAILVGSYIIIGVPLFELTMIELVSLLVERAVRARERNTLRRPLTEGDWNFMTELLPDETDSESDEDQSRANDSEADVMSGTRSERRKRRKERSHSQTSGISSITAPKKLVETEEKADLSLESSVIDSGGAIMRRGSASSLAEHLEKESLEHVRRERRTRGRSRSNLSNRSGLSSRCSSSVRDSSSSSDQPRNIDLGDFIVLELLRTQRVTQEELMELKMLFDELDGESLV